MNLRFYDPVQQDLLPDMSKDSIVRCYPSFNLHWRQNRKTRLASYSVSLPGSRPRAAQLHPVRASLP